jgi:hypothetical protein
MTGSPLVGAKVAILVSDPWDFVTEHGTGPFRATVLQLSDSDPGGSILVQLQNPLVYKGIRCEYIIVSPRYDGEDILSLASGKFLCCSLTQLPADRVDSADPFDLSWWRGGIGLLGSIRRL